MSELPEDVSRLLQAVTDGRKGARDDLFAVVYEELRRIAHAWMRREPPGNTLQTTALVNEAYLKLIQENDATWENRAHFFGVAAEAMRRILIDRVRRRKALKRGGDRQRVPLADPVAADDEGSIDLLALDDALGGLEEWDERKSTVVKLRYFVGLTVEETAEALGITDRTVYSEWRLAKAWLRRAMAADPPETPDGE